MLDALAAEIGHAGGAARRGAGARGGRRRPRGRPRPVAGGGRGPAPVQLPRLGRSLQALGRGLLPRRRPPRRGPLRPLSPPGKEPRGAHGGGAIAAPRWRGAGVAGRGGGRTERRLAGGSGHAHRASPGAGRSRDPVAAGAPHGVPGGPPSWRPTRRDGDRPPSARCARSRRGPPGVGARDRAATGDHVSIGRVQRAVDGLSAASALDLSEDEDGARLAAAALGEEGATAGFGLDVLARRVPAFAPRSCSGGGSPGRPVGERGCSSCTAPGTLVPSRCVAAARCSDRHVCVGEPADERRAPTALGPGRPGRLPVPQGAEKLGTRWRPDPRRRLTRRWPQDRLVNPARRGRLPRPPDRAGLRGRYLRCSGRRGPRSPACRVPRRRFPAGWS